MRNKRRKHQRDEAVTLGDMLNENIVEQLQDKKKTLRAEERARQAELEEKKRQERKEREKNKSFEQLLNESDLDWEQFK